MLNEKIVRELVAYSCGVQIPNPSTLCGYAAEVIEEQAKEIEGLRAQVVHGRWIYDEKAQRPYCSVCKGYFYGATNSSMNYCSNCRAKMDGGDDHTCL